MYDSIYHIQSRLIVGEYLIFSFCSAFNYRLSEIAPVHASIYIFPAVILIHLEVIVGYLALVELQPVRNLFGHALFKCKKAWRCNLYQLQTVFMLLLEPSLLFVVICYCKKSNLCLSLTHCTHLQYC